MSALWSAITEDENINWLIRQNIFSPALIELQHQIIVPQNKTFYGPEKPQLPSLNICSRSIQLNSGKH